MWIAFPGKLLVNQVTIFVFSFIGTVAQKAKPSKDEIKFDSDEDLPGLDDPDKTSRDTPIPPAKAKQERTSGRNSPGSSGDIFDDGDDLPDTGNVF